MPRRTTARSRSGTKLYVRRNEQGQFSDIQSYKRAHGSDIKRRSKAEAAKRTSKTTSTRKTRGTRGR
jgi:hypothetical protein